VTASKDPAATAVKVRKAAEQLATELEAAADTRLSLEAVAELRHIHSLTEQVKGAVQELHTTTSRSAEEVKEALVDLQPALSTIKEVKAAIQSLEATMKKEGRLQALRWALTNVKEMNQSGSWLLEDFTYTTNWSTGKTMKASVAITNALISGMMGTGYFIQTEKPDTKEEQEQGASARDKIKKQVFRLTGIEPRLVDKGAEGWVIRIGC
jgi:hypothetical protein